jgi:hypothetical protein
VAVVAVEIILLTQEVLEVEVEPVFLGYLGLATLVALKPVLLAQAVLQVVAPPLAVMVVIAALEATLQLLAVLEGMRAVRSLEQEVVAEAQVLLVPEQLVAPLAKLLQTT